MTDSMTKRELAELASAYSFELTTDETLSARQRSVIRTRLAQCRLAYACLVTGMRRVSASEIDATLALIQSGRMTE